MGWTLWILRLQQDGWHRVPQAWYRRFLKGQEPLEEREGTVLQLAQAAIELEEREPVQLGRLWYVTHQLGQGGFIDQERETEARRTEAEMVDLGPESNSDTVVAAGHRFAQRRYQHLSQWQPSVEEQRSLYRFLRSLEVPC